MAGAALPARDAIAVRIARAAPETVSPIWATFVAAFPAANRRAALGCPAIQQGC